MKRWLANLAIAALVMPPLPTQGKSIIVRMCGDTAARAVIPMGAPLSDHGDEHGCSKMGCHVASDRRKKADGSPRDP